MCLFRLYFADVFEYRLLLYNLWFDRLNGKLINMNCSNCSAAYVSVCVFVGNLIAMVIVVAFFSFMF